MGGPIGSDGQHSVQGRRASEAQWRIDTEPGVYDRRVTLVEVVMVEAVLGESPLWDSRLDVLYWADIKGERVGVLDWGSGSWQTWPCGLQVGSLALTSMPGRLIAATSAGLVLVEIGPGGYREVSTLAAPETHMPGNRFNDGKTDRQGRFWTGTMDGAELDRTGAMYRFSLETGATRMWGDVGIPNGLAFSPDGRLMYVADSMDGIIWIAEYDADLGQPGPRRQLVQLGESGAPDGSTVDADGLLWNAEWGAGRLTRYRADGQVDRVLTVPVDRPTCPAFGGTGLDLLFVTTAHGGPLVEGPSGAILVYDVGAVGIPESVLQLGPG